MTLNEILVSFPQDIRWIEKSPSHAKLLPIDNMNGDIFWDENDPQNIGWIYRISFHESTDGYGISRFHEISGHIDDCLDIRFIIDSIAEYRMPLNLKEMRD